MKRLNIASVAVARLALTSSACIPTKPAAFQVHIDLMASDISLLSIHADLSTFLQLHYFVSAAVL